MATTAAAAKPRPATKLTPDNYDRFLSTAAIALLVAVATAI